MEDYGGMQGFSEKPPNLDTQIPEMPPLTLGDKQSNPKLYNLRRLIPKENKNAGLQRNCSSQYTTEAGVLSM